METINTGSAVLGYPDSVDSSPRSRGAESWDEPFPSSSSSSKLRLMCSYGGRIVPRPTDKSLCYVGGDTRIVTLDRNFSLSDLSSKLSRSHLSGRPFLLKYQLPNEDLDSLISVTTDEDLDNMIDEYDRLLAGNPTARSSSRLRLFLFPSKPDSVGSLLDDSKSEAWFLDALNGSVGMRSTDSATSINCLLGLEDDSSTHYHGGGGDGAAAASAAQADRKLEKQDVQFVREYSVLDTSSSFGSTSSAPSPPNQYPIRFLPEDRPPDQRIGGFEDHFSQINLSAAAIRQRMSEGSNEEGFAVLHQAPPPPIPLPTTSPTENPNRVFMSDDDEKSDHGRTQNPAPVDLHDTVSRESSVISASRPMYYQERSSSTATNPVPVSDSGYRMQMQVPDPRMQQQQQFIHTNSPYVTHQVPNYYQMQYPIQQSRQTHPFDHQVPMYYLPFTQNSPYNLPVQPNLGDAATIPSTGKPNVPLSTPSRPELPVNFYRTAAAGTGAASQQPLPPSMIHVTADQAHAYPGTRYHPMHHHPSQGNYAYEFPDQLHSQMYCNQTVSTALHPQYLMVNSEAPPPQFLTADVKQTRGS